MHIKYCGIQTIEDFQLAKAGLADYVGFIFYSKSKRYVTPEKVQVMNCSGFEMKKVGVFVNGAPSEVLETAVKADLQVIQCHGNESPEELIFYKNVGYEVWKALPHGPQTLQAMERYKGVVDGYVIDSKVKEQFGGTGVAFDWNFVPAYTNTARSYSKKCFIAGGITESNIDSLMYYHPDGIDLSSGIESDGKKDQQKIKRIERKILHDIQSSR
ncbi:hypothetical protein A2U94_04900 [Bacillus sp. VT 712]|uniref:N-(5'-phosphoribosyl)anthranilate isomerase n=2 Tax=Priestia TaxID=2800373 RepID=A0A0V8JRM1_9BACI|nr:MULTISPECIES: phosphoribosylanthranilate isomerase [Bacillaceae]KSU89606.1 hypothetical protein AS180_01435 [Priestia veravalensis]KZB92553.1 hypothetical protein A2U94_04900 [Bacillus sp. VT 712]MDW8517551.1 phosphoribosylanthranilate isomerase [Priestia flexa]SCB80132.1 phosphoribosylanthranilate isomerase [Priestia flexa]